MPGSYVLDTFGKEYGTVYIVNLKVLGCNNYVGLASHTFETFDTVWSLNLNCVTHNFK